MRDAAMSENQEINDKNVSRRDFLKRLASTAIFIVPTIQTFALLDVDRDWWWWTGHHHHHTPGQNEPIPPLPPPPPPGHGTP